MLIFSGSFQFSFSFSLSFIAKSRLYWAGPEQNKEIGIGAQLYPWTYMDKCGHLMDIWWTLMDIWETQEVTCTSNISQVKNNKQNNKVNLRTLHPIKQVKT
jgi:hypothetical protein